MNVARLLALYEQVAEAPNAIGCLRRFVLDLAVRGWLVAQNADDEPASELLKQIEKTRRTAAAGTKRSSTALKPTPFGGELYPTPSGWEWAALAAVSDVTMGQSPPGSTYNTSGEGVPLINGPVEFTAGPFGRTVVNQFTTAPTNFCAEGDLLICVRGSTTGRTNIAAFKACIGRGVAAIRSAFEDEFIRLFLWKSREDIIAMGRGIAFPSVTKKQLENLAIPLPPLAEQRRIVAKVEELMALLDRLEAARAAREATRERLTTASLNRLTAPESTPEEFPSHARFALHALPALSTRPDQIKSLRQTILNLAVRGKLVEQNPNDEPASELLKRIAAEKTRLEKGGEIKVRKTNARERIEPLHFSLPTGWDLTELGDVALKITDGAHKTPTYVEKGVPFVSVKDFSAGKLDLSNTRFIPEGEHKVLYQRCDPRRGDILLGRIGTLGKPVLVDTDMEFSLFVSVGLIRFDHRNLLPEFFRLLLNSPFVGAEFDRIKIGGGTHTNKLNLGDLHTVALPLPPLAEQHRIVAKVDALMALCDRLEAALATSDTTKQRLLEALLREALEPTLKEAA